MYDFIIVLMLTTTGNTGFKLTTIREEDITGFKLTTTREEDITMRIPSMADCSQVGNDYSFMDDGARRRTKRFLPKGCKLVSAQGNFVDCVKTVCPCKAKACGEVCVPGTPNAGQSKCQTHVGTNGGRSWSSCVPAASVKCTAPGTDASKAPSMAVKRETGIVVVDKPTKTTKATDKPTTTTTTTTNNKATDKPSTTITGHLQDCSQAGTEYSYMDATERTQRERFGVPPGCKLVFGRGDFVNCVKTVCPCRGKTCGDVCVPATGSLGLFKCQTTDPKQSNCVALKCVAVQKTTGKSRTNVNSTTTTKTTGKAGTTKPSTTTTTTTKTTVTKRKNKVAGSDRATTYPDSALTIKIAFVAVLLPAALFFSQERV